MMLLKRLFRGDINIIANRGTLRLDPPQETTAGCTRLVFLGDQFHRHVEVVLTPEDLKKLHDLYVKNFIE